VEVSFLRTASREGYRDDSLCDISEVKFIAFLHNVIKVCTSVKKLDVAVQSKAAEKKHTIINEKKLQLRFIFSLRLQLTECLQSSNYSVQYTNGVN